MARRKIRFGFTIAEGPNAGRSIGGWRLWVHGEDTYLTATSIGHVWKVSLHGDAAWRMAVTKEHLNSPNPLWTDPDRAPWKFEPVPFENGGRMAFALAVQRGALFQDGLLAKDTPIFVNDRWNELRFVPSRWTLNVPP